MSAILENLADECEAAFTGTADGNDETGREASAATGWRREES